MADATNRRGRWLILAALAVVVLAAILLAALHLAPVQRYLFARVTDSLAAGGIRLSAREFAFNLFTGSLRLADVELAARESALPPLLTAESADVRVATGSLLRGRVRLSIVELNGVRIRYAVDAQGRDNLPQTTGGGKTADDAFWIEAVRVAGSLEYDDRKRGVLVRAPAWSLTARDVSPVTAHEAVLRTTAAGDLRYQQYRAPIDSLELSASRDRDALTVSSLRFVSGESNVSASGAMTNLSGEPRIDAGVNALLQLALLPDDQRPVDGAVTAALKLSGPVAGPLITGELRGAGLRARDFGAFDATIRPRLVVGADRAAIESLEVRYGGGLLQAEGGIALNDAAATNVNGRFQNVDLARITRAAKSPAVVASLASGTLSVRFPGLNYRAATGQAAIGLTAAGPAAHSTLPVNASLRAEARDGDLTLAIEPLTALGVDVAGTVALSRTQALSGALEVTIPSLPDATKNLRQFNGGSIGAVEGAARASVTLAGTLDQPTAGVEATVTGLRTGELKPMQLEARLDAGAKHLTLHNANLGYQDRTLLAASGSFAYDGPIEGTAKADALPIAVVREIAGITAPLEGDISGQFAIGGTAKSPSAQGHITISRLQAYSENFGQLDANLQLQGRTARLTNVALRKPSGGELKGEATYQLDDERYQVSAAGSGLVIEGLKLPSGETLRTTASLKISGDGTLANKQLEAQLNAAALHFGERAIGAVEAQANLLGEGLTLNVRLPDYNATAVTRMSIEAPYAATIQAKLEQTDLAKLPLTPPVNGTLTANVEATGDLDHWQDGEAKGAIESLTVEREGARIQTAAPAAFSLARRTARMEPLKLVTGESSLTIEGSMPVEASATPADLRLDGELTSADAIRLAAAFSSQPAIEASGKATVNLAVKGPWKQFTPEGSVKIQAQSVRIPDVPEITAIDAQAEIRQGTLHVDALSARLGEASINGSGNIPLSLAVPQGWLAPTPAAGPGKLQLTWDKVDIAMLARQKDGKLGGTFSGQTDLQVSSLTPRGIEGSMTLTPLDLRIGTLAFALEQPARLTVRNGVARVDQFQLKGSAGTLSLGGEAGLLAPQPIRLKAEGTLDAAIIGTFSEDLNAAGEAKLEIQATGTASQPLLAGFLEFPRLDASVPSMDFQLDGVRSRIDFDRDRVTLSRLAGTLNGGTLSGGGGLRIVKGEPQDVNLNLTAANVYLQYPRDLKTLFNAAIGLRSSGAQYVLNGDVQVLEGSYDEDINIDEFVLQGVNEVAAGDEEASDFMRRLKLNVSVRTASPILIKNNLAETAVSADLRAVGTARQPGLTGRLTLEEGGQIRLNEREYLVERGVVTFTDERRIKPALDLLARTQVSGHDITLQVQGEQGDLKSTLTSDPPLPEADVVSLLVTGRTLDKLAGAETDATKEQVLSYLATRVGGELTRSVERTFGISQVRIQPNLIAPESDPGARLTVGQDITPQVRLTYSMDLARSSDQFWLGEWDLTRRFRVRGLKDFNNIYRFEFRHEIQFGSIGAPIVDQPRAPIRRIGAIRFNGNFYLNDKELADRLKLKSGKKHDFFAVRKAVERLQKTYWSRDFHEARVRTDRDIRDSIVDLTFGISEGPRVKIAYEGWNPPGGVRKEVLRIWQQGGFDTGRVLKATAELRKALLADGYLDPLVAHQIRQVDDQTKQVLFEIHPNVRYSNPEIEIQGASNMPEKRLRRVIASHRPATDIYLRPQRVADAVRRLYRQEGYLEASVAAPRLETDAQAAKARLIVKVEEGPQFSIGAIRFEGNEVYSDEELAAALVLQSGQTYLDQAVESAVQELLNQYSALGFNDVEIETTARRDSAKGSVEVEFQIAENRQSVLEEVTLSGNLRTSRSLVLSQSGLTLGDIINPRKFSDARRNLYQTGAFSLVDIETEEIGDDPQVKRLRARLSVRELTPFALKYGGYYDNDRGPGAIFDFVTRNFLRSARVAGVRGRYDSRFQEIRGYFSQPLLRRFPVGTTSTVYFQREVRDAFIAERTGISVVQESRIRERWILNYGYRMERTHTFEREPDPLFPFDITLRVAPLQASLTHDNRDDILDATRGSFLSQSIEYAPDLLGSQLQFIRYYGQYFRYHPLTKPAEIPWSGGARRPRVIYAGAVRVGVAGGLGGQDLVASERFFAGGGTSIRGFRQDRVGPVDFRGDPTGGDAMFVTNHELRFPAYSIFDGVAFVDAGNVFERASDLGKKWDLRTAAGFGVRLRTPYFLFRLDYGFNLNRRPGEDRGRFFFSIGQAF